jgi:hypothetical protein
MNVLLVEPDFPIPPKSKNHAHFLPVGLLKIGSYHKHLGDQVQLVRGNCPGDRIDFVPDEIKVTSLFTYWSKYVSTSVLHYRELYPNSRIEVGGIFASLMPQECKELSTCDSVKTGLYLNGAAENVDIDYSLLDSEVDYQIVHASRGCFRKCNFCGTWKIEPDVTYKKSILSEITRRKLIFYDNNLLANPYIDNILDELSLCKIRGAPLSCECQSGLDGRLLAKKPYLAKKLKVARFKNPRIAWDGPVRDNIKINNQIDILKMAGYKANCQSSEIFVFMVYNYEISYQEMCNKLDYCRKWGVLVIDCRYRPLNMLEDNYKPRSKEQMENEYYIHKGWSDWQVRDFRRQVRRQNIAIRLGLPGNKYIEGVERKFIPIS